MCGRMVSSFSDCAGPAVLPRFPDKAARWWFRSSALSQPLNFWHRRPVLTFSIPAFMEKGDIHIGFGIMGGWNQAQAHAQFVANIVDYGMNVQAALKQPRFTTDTFEGCDVEMEETVGADVRAGLSQRGQQIRLLEPFSFFVGQGAAVVRDSSRKVNFAAGDPRSDGAAIPQEPNLK